MERRLDFVSWLLGRRRALADVSTGGEGERGADIERSMGGAEAGRAVGLGGGGGGGGGRRVWRDSGWVIRKPSAAVPEIVLDAASYKKQG